MKKESGAIELKEVSEEESFISFKEICPTVASDLDVLELVLAVIRGVRQFHEKQAAVHNDLQSGQNIWVKRTATGRFEVQIRDSGKKDLLVSR